MSVPSTSRDNYRHHHHYHHHHHQDQQSLLKSKREIGFMNNQHSRFFWKMQRNRNRKFCCQSPKWSQITITYKSSKGNVNIRNSLLRHAQQYQVTLPPFHLKESNLQLKLTPRAKTLFKTWHSCPMSIHTVAVAQGQDSAGPLILPVPGPLILLISFPQDLDATCITISILRN